MLMNNGQLSINNSINMYNSKIINSGTIKYTNSKFEAKEIDSFMNGSTGKLDILNDAILSFNTFSNLGLITTQQITFDVSSTFENQGTIKSENKIHFKGKGTLFNNSLPFEMETDSNEAYVQKLIYVKSGYWTGYGGLFHTGRRFVDTSHYVTVIEKIK